MGVTSPRFNSPTRFARATRLSTRARAAVPGNEDHTASSSNFLRAHSRRVTVFAIACMAVFCPPLVILMWYAHTHLDGSVLQLRSYIRNEKGLSHIGSIWPVPGVFTLKMIAFFAFSQAVMLNLLPAAYCLGPVTPCGNRPLYKKNGFTTYWITMLTTYIAWSPHITSLLVLTMAHDTREKVFNPAVIYDHLGEIISASICISILLCFLLYVKGYLAPSSSDSGSSGSVILDIFWGMELHPRIGRSFDLKVFFSSRMGMMTWALLVVGCMCKQIQTAGHLHDSMFVTSSLMLVYITKHFWLEQSYLNSLDIVHDRAGLYTLWSSLVWIPVVNTSPALFLASHPTQLGLKFTVPIMLLGLISIFILYDCDNQRTRFRETDGRCLIWRKPPTKIKAHFLSESCEHQTSLLLTSGWWRLARHFHYFPELVTAFLWTLPCLLTHFLPYFYFISLFCLLIDRAKRDDNRCRRKYKRYWDIYCRKVPWKIVPHVY